MTNRCAYSVDVAMKGFFQRAFGIQQQFDRRADGEVGAHAGDHRDQGAADTGDEYQKKQRESLALLKKTSNATNLDVLDVSIMPPA